MSNQHILFITSNRIGDAVLTTGALNYLLKKYPLAKFTVACGKLPAPLFQDMPQLHKLITMKKQPMSKHWLDLWKQCKGRKWDVIVDFRGSAISYMLRTKKRYVYKGNPKGNTLPANKVEQFGRLIEAGTMPAPTLWLTNGVRAEAKKLMGVYDSQSSPILGVGPCANWGGKEWPIEYYISAVRQITDEEGFFHGARVAIFCAPDERERALPLIESLSASHCIDLAGKLDLRLTAACLRQCSLYMGNDSGLMHMAAALKRPTLGIFGPSKDQYYRPWGDHAAFIRTPESYDELVQIPNYHDLEPGMMMQNLKVEDVVQAVDVLAASTL